MNDSAFPDDPFHATWVPANGLAAFEAMHCEEPMHNVDRPDIATRSKRYHVGVRVMYRYLAVSDLSFFLYIDADAERLLSLHD